MAKAGLLYAQAQAEIVALETENQFLRDALYEYGEHKRGCQAFAPGDRGECNCGFELAMEGESLPDIESEDCTPEYRSAMIRRGCVG